MRLTLSVEAEIVFDHLEHNEPTRYQLVVEDLELLGELGIESVSLGAFLGQWVYMRGPTGRVGYWVTPVNGDQWMLESIDVD